MEIPEDEKVEVKPTWKLAWGLFWKMFLIGLGIMAVINVILYFVFLKDILATLLPLLSAFA